MKDRTADKIINEEEITVNILILNGSLRSNENTAAMANFLAQSPKKTDTYTNTGNISN